MNETRYWIAAVSKEHTQQGVKGSFMQVCHGKQAPLKRMKKGDYIIVYSSKNTFEGNEKCQAFTAIGQVRNDAIYQFSMSERFHPHRRDIDFFSCKETPIVPLINELDFILNKKLWGFPFRFGFFEIKENDFNLIASKMLQDEVTRQYV